jgi:hypothetical protein
VEAEPPDDLQGWVLRPLCEGDSREQLYSQGITDQRLRRSKPVQWAWLDLNQRPHPYQRSTAKRCAIRPFRSSRHSMSGTGMG